MTAFDFTVARAPAEARVATPLLAHLAGAHAPAIARVWPAPHVEFLTLSAARRHLAAIGLKCVRADEAAPLRGLIERAPLRDALAFALRPVPRGLARALTLMGETLWAEAEYDALLALLMEPNGNLVLRHLAAINPDVVARLAALPEELRAARIVENTQTAYAASVLGEAYAAARYINPKRPERDLVLAWSRAASAEALMRGAIDALKPDRFGRIGPAPDLPKPYRRLTGRAPVEAAALRFRNCIAGYLWELAADELAIFTWDGEPAAVVALKRDVGGWRFAEALAEENAPLPERVLLAMAADMERAGVRVGAPIRALEDKLESLADAAVASRPAAPGLAARLGLGQLWR